MVKPTFTELSMLTLLAVVLVGCQQKPQNLTFEVDPQFQGPFVLVEIASGERVNPKDANITLRVPNSGIVEVSSFEFLRGWRQVHATDSNNTPIKVYETKDEEIALRGGRRAEVNGSARAEYFIGTQKEFEAFDFEAWVARKKHLNQLTE